VTVPSAAGSDRPRVDGESALIVEVPAADALVGPWRLAHDPSAALGVPPHVTILYPFLRPEHIDEAARLAVGDVAAAVQPFEAELVSVEAFPDGVIWLAPLPAAGFRSLTTAATARFPDHPPYEGRFDEVIPHLTVGGPPAPAGLRQAIERDLAGRLPLPFRVETLSLFVSTGGRWSSTARFPLGRR
jgi:2'-5' RNA ligase